MKSTLLAYKENAGKREIGVLICGFRGVKFDEDEDDEEEEETIFFLILHSFLDIIWSEKRRFQKTWSEGRIYFLARDMSTSKFCGF